MRYMQRATLTALVAFFPICGLLWLGAPWSNSKADFEVTGTTLLGETRARFPNFNSVQASTVDSASWLESEEAAQAALDDLPLNRALALAEIGDTWSVKLRERMRALACYQPLRAWRIRERSVCSWIEEWLKPKTLIDQLEIIEERLSIHRSDDGLRIEISFRAADPDLATMMVDAFSDALLQHHTLAMRDLQSRIVEYIEAEITEVANGDVAPQPLPSESKNGHVNEDMDVALLRKFTDALANARHELPPNDRRQLDGDLEAVKAVARKQRLSWATDRRASSPTTKLTGNGAAAVPTNSLILLEHPDWSKPPVTRASETTTDGFSLPKIAMIASILSLLTGLALMTLWTFMRYQSDRQHEDYASPYANPHWPNMRVMEQAEPNKAA